MCAMCEHFEAGTRGGGEGKGWGKYFKYLIDGVESKPVAAEE